MNKKAGKLIVLLAALAVAIAVYFVASAIAKREESKNDVPDETKISIIDKDTADLASVTVVSASSEYSVVQSGGKFSIKDDSAFPLDQDLAAELAAAVTDVSANRLVADSGAESSEYGLDKPLYTVTAKYSDGAEMTFRIGSYNRYSDSYYMSMTGEDSVYLVEKTMTASFGYTLKELIVNETLTEPDEKFDALTAVEVAFSDGTGFKYTLVSGTTAESGDDSEDTEDKWTLALLSGTAIDGEYSDEAEALYDALFGYEPTDWVAYGISSEQLGEYGLDAPYAEITVYYNDTVVITPDDNTASITKIVEKTMKVRIGDIADTSDDTDDEESDTSDTTDTIDTTASVSNTDAAETGSNESETSGSDELPAETIPESRYLILDGGKIVYIAKLSDLAAVLELPDEK